MAARCKAEGRGPRRGPCNDGFYAPALRLAASWRPPRVVGGLRRRSPAVLVRLQRTARHGMVNETGPNSADTGPSKAGVACATGYCHVQFYPRGKGNPISFSDAYGAGMVNAAEAVD